MRKHVQKESEILKCISCEYESKDENENLNHIVDNHSTVHVCQTCDNRFAAKNELITHIRTVHGFTQNNASESFNEDIRKTIKCFNCETMLESKESLLKHKREQHWKEKKCAVIVEVIRNHPKSCTDELLFTIGSYFCRKY